MTSNTSSKAKTIPSYNKQDIEQCMNNFRLIVLTNINEMKKMKANLISSGKMSHSEKEYILGFSWRVFLDVISIDDKSTLKSIIEDTLNKRKTIKNLIKKNALNKFKGDPLGGLSGGGKNEADDWDSFFNQSDAIKLIKQDIDRTMPYEKLFREPYILEMESSLLKLFAKNHKDLSYKQGMNEILSVLIYSMYPYYVKSPITKITNEIIDKWVKDPVQNFKEIYYFFHDENELENDLYYLFENIMIKDGLGKFFDDPPFESGKMPYLIKRAKYIVIKKLSEQDRQIYSHIVNKGLDYTMIFQRWFKCLFKREFQIKDVLLIWDRILSNECDKPTGELTYIDNIVIAMILNVKYDLLNKDNHGMFEILLHYPPIGQINDFLNLIENIKDNLTVAPTNEEQIKQAASSSSKNTPIVTKDPVTVEGGSQSTKNVMQINPLLFNPNLILNPQLQNNQNMMFYPYNPLFAQQPIPQNVQPQKDNKKDFEIISKEDLSPMEKIKSSYYVSDSSSVNALKELKSIGNKYKNVFSADDKNRLDFLIDSLCAKL